MLKRGSTNSVREYANGKEVDQRWAQKRHHPRSRRPNSGSPTGYLTVSLGCYAFIPSGNDSPEAFIQRADAALYQAKNAGRNRAAVLSLDSGFAELMRSDR